MGKRGPWEITYGSLDLEAQKCLDLSFGARAAPDVHALFYIYLVELQISQWKLQRSLKKCTWAELELVLWSSVNVLLATLACPVRYRILQSFLSLIAR